MHFSIKHSAIFPLFLFSFSDFWQVLVICRIFLHKKGPTSGKNLSQFLLGRRASVSISHGRCLLRGPAPFPAISRLFSGFSFPSFQGRAFRCSACNKKNILVGTIFECARTVGLGPCIPCGQLDFSFRINLITHSIRERKKFSTFFFIRIPRLPLKHAVQVLVQDPGVFRSVPPPLVPPFSS